MNKLKLGSLFDGSGGFPLAGLMVGITPVWASDSEDCMLLPADGGAYNGLKVSSFTCVSPDSATIVVVQRG